MTFSSLTFTTLFFPAVLILYFICTDLRWRNGVLLVASLIFYSWGEPIWVLAMIGSTAINYVATMLIDRASSPGLSDPGTMAVIRKYTVLPLIAAIASLPILPRLKAWLGKHEKLEGAADIVSLVCLTALMLLSMIFIVGQSYNPFIYFRF